jgi:hypothetical protein
MKIRCYYCGNQTHIDLWRKIYICCECFAQGPVPRTIKKHMYAVPTVDVAIRYDWQDEKQYEGVFL